mmetsp:Transcript_49404/g.148846  ORF Transcript_49404/g.148846 Transcript_49404/m.148846 type:complete len:204 (-) Transcript_49404:412-1023(-)
MSHFSMIYSRLSDIDLSWDIFSDLDSDVLFLWIHVGARELSHGEQQSKGKSWVFRAGRSRKRVRSVERNRLTRTIHIHVDRVKLHSNQLSGRAPTWIGQTPNASILYSGDDTLNLSCHDASLVWSILAKAKQTKAVNLSIQKCWHAVNEEQKRSSPSHFFVSSASDGSMGGHTLKGIEQLATSNFFVIVTMRRLWQTVILQTL